MNPGIVTYNAGLPAAQRAVAEALAAAFDAQLPGAESKIWHRHPVWFLAGNPIVGYSLQKPGLRLMFWSGASFDEPGLNVPGAKFQDASVFLQHLAELQALPLERWLAKAQRIQWDYRNLVRRKGRLERLPDPFPSD
jgi:hypothetical protein